MFVKHIFLQFLQLSYRSFCKPLFFLCSPERVHVTVVACGEQMGKKKVITNSLTPLFTIKNNMLEQDVLGMHFSNSIGMSAGFDYEARLTQLLPALGFGFETVGTITNLSYKGNPRPMLGRLPKSKSLMVNKGFKNLGAKQTIRRLEKSEFHIPLGVSIGRSNNKRCNTVSSSIEDVIKAFSLFETSSVRHSYYELNISCPNLFGEVSFYPPKNLRELLTEIDKLHIKRPIFMKMPIERPDSEVRRMLDVIAQHSPKGVIFGNLQKNRRNKSFDRNELAKFPMGNFSGKPTYERSNALIELAYAHYQERFVIIGTGGVFTAADAYEKITHGATLVQLITGLIFNGPQVVAQINEGLIDLLKRDGFTHVSQAIGKNVKTS